MSLHQAYPVEYTQPIRKQLQQHDVVELVSVEDVQKILKKDSVLVLINSVCGCAGSIARPALYVFQKSHPEVVVASVFAGVHHDATACLREEVAHPPSSPSFAYFRNGVCVGYIHRSDIEGHSVEDVVSSIDSFVN